MDKSIFHLTNLDTEGNTQTIEVPTSRPNLNTNKHDRFQTIFF
jgi:hypothetical protein